MHINYYLEFIHMRVVLAGAVALMEDGEGDILDLLGNNAKAIDDLESVGYALYTAFYTVEDLIKLETKRLQEEEKRRLQ